MVEIIKKETMDTIIINTFTLADKALFATLWNTGHRISEVLELKRSDIWYDDKAMWFTLKVEKRRKEFIHTIKIPMNASYVSYIKEYVDTIPDPNQKLFDITRQYVNIKLTRICDELVIPKITPHDFRHSLATRLAARGCNKYELDAFFGWSENANTSGIYVQKGTALLENIFNKFD